MADKRKFIKAGEAEAPKKAAPKKKAAPREDAPKKSVKRSAQEEEAAVEEAAVEEAAAYGEEDERDFVEVDHSSSGKTKEQRAKGFRAGAWVLWIVGILCEVLAILILNKTIYVAPERFNLFFFGALALDLVAVVIASQLWKKANHIDPISKKNKAKFVFHNNLGVVMSIIAFLPILILLLTNKDLDKKTKKIASIVAAAALVVASVASIDFNPVSQEELEAAKEDASEYAFDGSTVYWTQFGKSYHYDPDCHTIRNSSNVYYGTVDEAFEAKRSDPCDFCVKDADAPGRGAQELAEGAENLLEEAFTEAEDAA